MISRSRSRGTGFSAVAAARLRAYSCAFTSSSRSIATPLVRLPGDFGANIFSTSGPMVMRQHRARVEHVAGGEHVPRLDHHRLTAHQRARSVAGVDRGDAVVPEPADQQLARIVGVHRAEVGLDGIRLFQLILVERAR